MQGILADVNIQGHVGFLIALARSSAWIGIWQELGIQYQTFRDAGIDADATDVEVWQYCQDHQYVLITSNRNEDDADSLETAIRDRGTSESLPVLTVSDPERFHKDRPYVDRVVEALFDILLNIDAYRGAGRLYLP